MLIFSKMDTLTGQRIEWVSPMQGEMDITKSLPLCKSEAKVFQEMLFMGLEKNIEPRFVYSITLREVS